MSLAERLMVKPGSRIALRDEDAGATPGFPDSADKSNAKDRAESLLRDNVARIADLQYDLYAENTRSLLVVLQGTDTSGKDGVIRHVFSGVNPQGVRVESFKQPSTLELDHDFLWRIHLACPQRGEIGVFNRSHYESVLVERVRGLVPEKTWRARYALIKDFERLIAKADSYTPPSDHGGRPTRGREGCVILKFFLHISKDEQAERLRARLADPRKNWKVNPADLEERKRWDEYVRAYEDALAQCSTEHAPWFMVPSDKKWYQRWAVSQIVRETLDAMEPKTPRSRHDLSNIRVE
jgi:polyphosphate kinase 2 (PPK2 family)